MDARKTRYGADDVRALFADARRIVVARGKKTLELDPDAGDVGAAVLGRSGNLRAPTARVGDTWLVGYGEEAWKSVLG